MENITLTSLADLLFSAQLNIASVTLRLILAALLSGFIGIGRGRHGHAAGLRTHIIICIGSAMTAMIGLYVFGDLGLAEADPLRISAQVMSGIGFIGVGTIMIKGNSHVTGLTTAVGLWTTAAIGIAVGIGFFHGALICTLVTLFAMVILEKLEKATNLGKRKGRLYLECTSAESVNGIIDVLTSKEFLMHNIEVVTARSCICGHVGIECMYNLKRGTDRAEVVKRLQEIPDIVYAVETH